MERCRRPVVIGIIAVVVLVIVAVIVVVVVAGMNRGEDEEPPVEYDALCKNIRTNVRSRLEVLCDYSEDVHVDSEVRNKLQAADVDLGKMGVKINGEAENSFRCVYQTLEGKFECTGRHSKCSDNGDLELTFVDANNGVVHSEKIKITVAERHLSLAINQTFPKTAQGDASTFHMYCGVEAACDNYTMEIATGDTKIINIPGRSEVSCGKTKRTNDGDYDIQCNATVNGEMLLSQEFFNTSCSLRRSNQTIAQSESFEMPFCHDLSSSCSCKGANNSCASICNVAGKCLLEAGYQSFNASVTGCDTRCMLKWCLREHNSTIVATQENIIFEICELVGDCPETGLC